MIGNSSSGFVEAPYFYLPVINIGNRQMGRQSYRNVINVDVNSKNIVEKIKEYLHNKKFRNELKKSFDYPYGKGNSSQSIAQVLAGIKIDRKLIQKKITY